MKQGTTHALLGLGGLGGAYYLARRALRATDFTGRAGRAKPGGGAADRGRVRGPAAAGPATRRPARVGPIQRAVSRELDPIFAEHGHGLPVAYLRALAKRESNLNPNETIDPAWGLMQVVEVVRRDYNRRHGTRYTRQHLLDPRINVEIAADLLTRITASYARNHPGVSNLQADWDNPRFVELLSFGWVAGYSERGGVGRVARYLESRGLTDITIDAIFENARAAGASRHLSNPKKVRWAKSVAALFASERARDAGPPLV